MLVLKLRKNSRQHIVIEHGGERVVLGLRKANGAREVKVVIDAPKSFAVRRGDDAPPPPPVEIVRGFAVHRIDKETDHAPKAPVPLPQRGHRRGAPGA